MAALLCAASGASGQNLLPGDTSFEAGTGRWFGGSRQTTPEGEGVLRLNRPYCHSDIYYNLVEPGKEYVAGFRARSTGETVRVTASVFHVYYGYAGNPMTLTLGPEWKRFTIPIPEQPSRREIYFTFHLPEGAEIEVDDFTLNEGNKPEPWSPNGPFSVGIEPTGAPGNLLFPDEPPPELAVGVVNNSSKKEKLRLKVTATDFYGAGTVEKVFENELENGKAFQAKVVPLPAMRRGYYVVKAELTDSAGRLVASDAMPFGVVPHPVAATLDEASFGTHPDPSRVEMAALARIGVKWLRPMPTWSDMERSPGVYRFPFAEYDANDRKFGFSSLMSIKLLESPPRFVRREQNRFADFTQMRAFLTAAAKAAPPGVRAWEIENEPDLCYPTKLGASYLDSAAYYGTVVREAVEALRAVDPVRPVSAMSVSGSNTGSVFAGRAAAGCADSFQIWAPHPYTGARYIGPKSTWVAPDAYIRERMLEFAELAKGKRLWAGEVGWAFDWREPFGSQTHRDVSNLVARALILMKSVPEVEKILYFKAQGCYERDFYQYGLWRGEFEPLPSAVFFANIAARLEHSRPLPPVFESDLRIYPFLDRENKPFAAVWKYKGELNSIRLRARPGSISATDLFGNPVELKQQDGALELPLSETPIWVAADGFTPEEFKTLLGETEIDLPPVTLNVIHFDGKSLTGFVRNNLPRTTAIELTASGCAPKSFPLPASGVKSVTFDFPKSRQQPVELRASDGKNASTLRLNPAELVPCPQSATAAGSCALFNLTERRYIYPPDPGIAWRSAADLSGKFGIGYDERFFHFAADVTDPVHFLPAEHHRAWNGDSIQLAFDPLNDAQEGVFDFGEDDVEFIAWLGPKGARLARTFSGAGDFGEEVPGAKVEITRKGEVTSYRIAIPWAELGKLTPMAGRIFGMNFIVNQNNGYGRSYWLGLTEGIGEMKYPYLYRKFRLEP